MNAIQFFTQKAGQIRYSVAAYVSQSQIRLEGIESGVVVRYQFANAKERRKILAILEENECLVYVDEYAGESA